MASTAAVGGASRLPHSSGSVPRNSSSQHPGCRTNLQATEAVCIVDPMPNLNVYGALSDFGLLTRRQRHTCALRGSMRCSRHAPALMSTCLPTETCARVGSGGAEAGVAEAGHARQARQGGLHHRRQQEAGREVWHQGLPHHQGAFETRQSCEPQAGHQNRAPSLCTGCMRAVCAACQPCIRSQCMVVTCADLQGWRCREARRVRGPTRDCGHCVLPEEAGKWNTSWTAGMGVCKDSWSHCDHELCHYCSV